MNRKVNFNSNIDAQLTAIPEGAEQRQPYDDDYDDSDTYVGSAAGSARSHSIHEVVSAKMASKIFRLRSLQAKKIKQRDEGYSEQVHADYPLLREDLMLFQTKSSTRESSLRISSALPPSDANFYHAELRTYNMQPLKVFKEHQAKIIIRMILEENLHNKAYDAETCRFKSRQLADLIKEKVKKLFLPRYKFICIVHIGQVENQSLQIASRCSWDTNVDDFAECTYQNDSLWAVGLVYAVYHE
eukprot:gene564-1222_t